MRFSSTSVWTIALMAVINSPTAMTNAWMTTPVASSSSSHLRTTTNRTPLRLSSSSATTTAAADERVVRGKVKSHDHCREPHDRDILVRAARGETVERTPVWMMRQAGRYMEAFREYSDVLPFRERSETPDYAVELSLQCHRAYGMDGIIMFSDILTPLPTLGIDFDVVKGTGPVITTKVRTEEDVNNMPRHEFDDKVPFIKEILNRLSQEAEDANTSLIGFVGAPFTLAAYTIEGKSSKDCLTTKKLLMADERGDNACISLFLDKLADMIGDYACYQIEHGAQVIQVFESWAHQLSPHWFETYAKPAAQKAIRKIKSQYPDTPVIYFANGGSSYLELQRDMGADMIAVDWAVNLSQARTILGPDVPVSGNLDPTVLFGSKEQIEQAVRDCIDQAGGPGRHLLNLGHGVMQGTPEEAVKWLVDEVKRYEGKA
jgi:uroporphyrinogen decarboxylase